MKMKILATLLIVSILLCSMMPAMASGDKYDLSSFGWMTVDSKGRGSLVFQKVPYGKSIKGHKFYTGDLIYVNLYYRESGYAFAYENGEYGYVDASYIDWGDNNVERDRRETQISNTRDSIPDIAKDLADFEYKLVESRGRGSLVFQMAPGGKFMSNHKFYDGDWIYVNINYRKNGYTVAYENGVYGFVDASYINWDDYC